MQVRFLSILAIAAACAVPASAALPRDTPVCALDWTAQRLPSSVGDPRMAPAMDALRMAWSKVHPNTAAPAVWRHVAQSQAIGALMFGLADVAPTTRDFSPAELAPYDHQFRGDMMKAPLLLRIGTIDGTPAMIAVNRRPDSPLPRVTAAFLDFALSPTGQSALGRVPGFSPLTAADAAREAARLPAGYLAPLDPALHGYKTREGLHGAIVSVGSDGMKDLMDGWECRFAALQPGVSKGERWEHLGTLNGFHALINGQADIAPMGRELWPQEREAWQSALGKDGPVEIAVARGGFDTPQRTTAQAIFVHPDNPLRSISLDQLRRVFGKNPAITRWGQLGLNGEWAERPIHVLMPPKVTPNAMSMQLGLLQGQEWAVSAIEAPYTETAKALAADPAAIGFGGLEEGLPSLHVLAVVGDDGVAVPLTAENAATGRYPLTRLMYIRLAPGKSLPQVTAFLRYILSREGQERVRYSGYYPLTAREAERELAKVAAIEAQ